jgi:hypothetical protein
MKNILDYLDEPIELTFQKTGNYPNKFVLPKKTIIEIEKLLKEGSPIIDNCWIDFKKDGLLDNYRGIPLEVEK